MLIQSISTEQHLKTRKEIDDACAVEQPEKISHWLGTDEVVAAVCIALFLFCTYIGVLP